MHYQIIKQVPALLLNYHPKSTRQLPFLDEFEHYQHRFNDTFIIRKVVRTTDYSPDELEILDKLFVLPHPGLLRVISYQRVGKDRFEIYFEDIEGTLQDDISTRNKLSKNYTDSQLIEMLKNLSDALAHLAKYQIPHKQVTLESILITPKGEAKLIHPLLIGSRVPTYNKILLGSKESDMKYLPPEVIDCLIERKTFPETNPFKEDVYSLGVCFLEAAKISHRIEWNHNRVQDKLSHISGVKITQILHKMVEESAIMRIDASSLSSMLSLAQKITKLAAEDQEDKKFLSARLSTDGANTYTSRKLSPPVRRTERRFEDQPKKDYDPKIKFTKEEIENACLMAERIMRTDFGRVREVLDQNRNLYRDNSADYTARRKITRNPSHGYRNY